MKIALVQSKPIAGDLSGNLNKITNYINKAKEDKVEQGDNKGWVDLTLRRKSVGFDNSLYGRGERIVL